MNAFSFVQTAPDLTQLRNELTDPACGGYASFEGWVRNSNEGHDVRQLEYEAFEALAVKEGERIVAEAIRRFGVTRAACVHRLGSLEIGGLAVWVGVSAGHRAEAFAACRYIIDEVKHRVPIWKKEHYVNGDSGWVNCERCAAPGESTYEHSHDHAHHQHDAATPARFDYARQISLPEVGASGQKKLSAARVLVIGAGGLGIPVLTYLAGAGIGTLGVVDGDVVDASNLHRQTLYSLSDAGAPKAEIAVRRLRALNPDIVVQMHRENLTTANALDLCANYDVIVDCTDNFSAKFLISDAAVRLKKSAIFASIYQYEGQLQVYRPDMDSACLRCLWPEATRDGLVGNCAEAGVLGPVPGVLGSLQALEVLKLLLNLPGQLHDEVLLLDLLTLQQHKIRARRRADCDHETPRNFDAPITEVEVGDLNAARVEGYRIIDIRDANEIAAEPLPIIDRTIPMGELLADSSALHPDEKYLLVCARGARSATTTAQLRARGLNNVYSLSGGLRALKRTPQSA